MLQFSSNRSHVDRLGLNCNPHFRFPSLPAEEWLIPSSLSTCVHWRFSALHNPPTLHIASGQTHKIPLSSSICTGYKIYFLDHSFRSPNYFPALRFCVPKNTSSLSLIYCFHRICIPRCIASRVIMLEILGEAPEAHSDWRALPRELWVFDWHVFHCSLLCIVGGYLYLIYGCFFSFLINGRRERSLPPKNEANWMLLNEWPSWKQKKKHIAEVP